MRVKILNSKFFNRSTIAVAKNLLGKFLVRTWRGRKIIGMVTETEAYIGPHDRASHAYRGKRTPRNIAEFMDGGHVYIYLVYGMYWQFNISTAGEGKPECVLIRAVNPTPNSRELENKGVADGPGKLCRYFKLDKSFYAEDVTKSNRLWLEDRGVKIPKRKIEKGPRVGIDYAGPYWAKRHLRFWVA